MQRVQFGLGAKLAKPRFLARTDQRFRHLQVGGGLLDLVLRQPDPAVGDLRPGIGARQFIGISDTPFGAPRARRSDTRAPRLDPRGALAAQFERVIILQRRLGPSEAAIGRRTAEIFPVHADRRVGPGARLFGKPFGLLDTGIEDCDPRRCRSLA